MADASVGMWMTFKTEICTQGYPIGGSRYFYVKAGLERPLRKHAGGMFLDFSLKNMELMLYCIYSTENFL